MINKRVIGFLLLFIALLTNLTSAGQEYNYVHYDVKDGLAASTVYDLCQDKYGFVWFATEAGISRFDGTHFKNFTTADGLPETEIIKLFADSKGRIWMAPFKNAICYYYNGKIHNQDNDPLLKQIKLNAVVGCFSESPDKYVGLYSDKDLIIIDPNDKIQVYNQYIQGSKEFGLHFAPDGHGFSLIMDDSCYLIKGSTITKCPCAQLSIRHAPPNLEKKILGIKSTSINMLPGTENLVFVNSYSGTWMLDTITNDRFQDFFLKDKQIGHSMIDNEQNFWFATLGEGVYKLASREFKSYYFRNSPSTEIFSFNKMHNRLFAGSAFARIYALTGSKLDTLDFISLFKHGSNYNCVNRVTCIKSLSSGNLVAGTDGMLVKEDIYGHRTANTRVYAVKSIDEIDSGRLLVGTGRRVLMVNEKDLLVKDTVCPNRSTSVCFYNNAYYIGTVNGLLIMTKDKQVRYMGNVFPALRHRISYFARGNDGTLWVATYGGGVICMKNDRVINQITTWHGLSSNICRTLFVNKQDLWVGTDKGLNKINISQSPYPVITYGTSDGLPSDIISAVYADSNMVYVGSPAGLTFFDETKVNNYSKCNLRILDVWVGNTSQPVKDAYQIRHRENSFKISYAGISFKSGGSISYRYRLKGLKDTWDSTTQNVLEYPSLPAGNYEFELIAVNRKGVVSNPVHIAFVVEAAFWQTLPFQILVIATVILLTWILVAWRFSIIRRQEQERTALQQRLNDLEQMALRAQMNPHFIFNCLNSIQNFIINNNLEASNQYLTEFAHLIRQTLDNSEKSTISIANEVKYLKRYLELEMMRFGRSFSYNIEIDPELDAELVAIPTMILQPFIENSIRHGIRYKSNSEGRIDIKFLKSINGFVCIIQDNGIGRKKASEFKSKIHVEYQSKGISLTTERINILNRQQADPITIEIVDLTDDALTKPLGTRVIIRFPDTIIFKPVKNDTNRNH